jgi:NAD(P)H dehydrogenase (quinone)
MIAVTGATGHLGRLAIEELLRRGIAPAEIVAVVRNPEKAADLAGRGLQLRRATYDDPSALEGAFAGIERLLFISGDEVGRRVTQHGNVVRAAKAAGVGVVAYTSVLNADRTRIKLAEEHKATERLLEESDVPFILLRNSWYLELYLDQIPRYLEHGAILGSAGEGRVSAATRADYAAAAAAVVAEPGYEHHIFELGGEPAFSMAELAAEISGRSGREVVYRNLPVEEYVAVLTAAGLPEGYARVLADADLGIERGDLFTGSGDMARLLGRGPTSYTAAVASALQQTEPA